ncbi:MAG: TAT-variant-translocated molybdopterin oxidoreductase [Mucilaginibacter polytrichastri]|nr:TAT-variant-translocated molybdopterin oxidoreductase [Mucilaginibacter polytrichastri]
MESNKKYWKGLDELNKTPEFVEANRNEFAEALPIEEVLQGAGLKAKTPRRDFLKALGFGVGAVSLAACNRAPVRKSIPYLIKPEEITPGVANYYASSYKGQSIWVKTREGRPIKVEGNPSDIFTKGGSDAQTQASVLELYDYSRLQNPVLKGAETTWTAVDNFVWKELDAAQAAGKQIRIVSAPVNSPTAKAVIAEFIKTYPNARHINHEALSYSGIMQANQASFGKAVLPRYNFGNADVIVSFSADFLGTWISPEEFTRQYVSNRNAESLERKKMSRHIQFETGMSLTGTNADARIPVKPSEEGLAIIALYNALSGTTLPGTKKIENSPAEKALALAAKELQAAKGRALVVSGSNDVAVQTLVNAINNLLGSYGSTIDLDNPSYQSAGTDAEFVSFLNEMKRGDVGAVIFWDTNPAYEAVNEKEFADALKKVKAKIAITDRLDETASLCDVAVPMHHYLESWGDANSVEGYYTLVQPTINPVYNTRQAEESLLKWAKNMAKNYYVFLQNNWNTAIFAQAGLAGPKAWENLLQTGFIQTAAKPVSPVNFAGNPGAAAQSISARSNTLSAGGDNGIQLHLYQSVAIRDGKKANNPWLQEMPDPVSKVTWDNYAAIAPKYAEKLGIAEGDVVEVKTDRYSVELPVLLQPGQAQGTVSIAVGYGRTKSGPVGTSVGKNAYPFMNLVNGTFQETSTATITKVSGEHYELAQTQTHHSYEGRNVVRETSFAKFKENEASGTGEHGNKHEETHSLWGEYKRPVYDWVMAIDLNACTGCGACIVACNAENNVPVVGRDEVRRRREMHWLRIDRYYSFNENTEKPVTEEREIAHLENMDSVSVIHQPMLCQHCDHAPCETVCPVLATMHSEEGLNHMAYNRCVGTRYCANNCPYKVRRFNWFNYWNDSRFDNYLNNKNAQLVLNPDVTTRFRGVMEKCSMCIQRIQAGKLKAKIDKRPLKDGEIKMACQQTCTANAIIFGNRNDPNSEVSKALKSERTYYVLEELNVQPGVGYQVKVRNSADEIFA